MLSRPPPRIRLLLAALLVGVGAAGAGALRAATVDDAVTAPAAVQVPAGVPGRCGGAATAATRELRGMWLTTVNNIDFPSRPGLSAAKVQAEYRGWLDLAQAQRHNAIFVHVRPSGDALWPSAYAPWSEWLTGKRDGKDPGWDPMAFMVAEAHARNLEFHAWFNPYRGSQPAPAGAGPKLSALAPGHPLRTHPEWALVHPARGVGSRLYFDPGIPQARRFVEDSMLEAVTRYDLDGVHFDDFFYPYPKAGEDFPDDASFARYGTGAPSRAAWRRANVDTLVREMSERIKAAKPWVKFGISPFGIWRNKATDPTGSATRGLESYDAIYADTRLWVRRQWLDYVVPQLYWHIGFDKADYAVVLPWWSTVVAGTRVQLYIGQGDYRIGERGAWSNPSLLDRQLTLNDRYPVAGSVHFSAKQIRADRLGAVTRYRDAHYGAPALVPVMAQLPAAVPAAPTITGARRDAAGAVTLTWRPAPGAPPVSWALYRAEAGAATAALVATGRSAGVAVDPTAVAGRAYSYCLSGLDRSWNEGPASGPISP
jgi:uncharacterized lipoprotein YddW (UPF0748 family)